MASIDRDELHRRIMTIKKSLEEGKLFIPDHLKDGLAESLEKVRIAPDGLVDPDTVDSRVRALGLGLAHLDDREETKKAISLKQIQEFFYARIDNAFRVPYQLMKEKGSDPATVAVFFANREDHRRQYVEMLRDIVEDLRSFWQVASEPSWIHGQDTLSIKGVYGGATFPSAKDNVVANCGLFFDTIILPDPIQRVRTILDTVDEARAVFDVTRLALEVLEYKPYIVNDLDLPLAAIIPDKFIADAAYTAYLKQHVMAQYISFMNKCLAITAETQEEISEHLRGCTSEDDIAAMVRDASDLVIYSGSTDSLANQLRAYREDMDGLPIGGASARFETLVLGRLFQANDLLRRSSELRAAPLCSWPTSWAWLTYVLRQGTPASSDALTSLHVAHALHQAGRHDMRWLGNIPADSLIEMRKTGALEEIRELLRDSVNSFVDIRQQDFGTTAETVIRNIQSALRDHERRIDALRAKRWKFASRDIASLTVVGGISIAAAFTVSPLLAVAGVLAGCVKPIPTIKDIIERQKDLAREQRTASQTPFGMLYQISRQAERE